MATYQVIDGYENLAEGRALIHEDHPHIKIDLDLEAMSADDRRTAQGVLQRSLDRLSAFGPAGHAPG